MLEEIYMGNAASEYLEDADFIEEYKIETNK